MKVDAQLITTLASGDCRSLKARVEVMSLAMGSGRSSSRNAASFRVYTSKGRTCQAYRVSPSDDGRWKGVTWCFAKPKAVGSSMSCQKRVLILWAYNALRL